MLFPLLAAVLDKPDDPALVQRLKRHEPQAMAELYDRYGRLVYSLIFRLIRDGSTAEDLVQETFLRVWNRAHLLDDRHQALGPWLLTVARNRAIDYLRSVDGRQARRATVLLPDEHPHLLTDLEAEILSNDRARRLRTAFSKLTTHQQQVIDLAYFEGLSQTEMAEKLQQPLGTVKTWVRTALRTLREELEAKAAL